MASTLPWEDMKKPSSGLNATRAHSAHPHAFFWARDTAGRYLFVLEIDRDKPVERYIIEKRGKILSRISGVEVDIRQRQDTGKVFLVLLLQEIANADIFYILCNDILQKTEGIQDLKTAIDTLFLRLEHWRQFFNRAKNSTLTNEEVQGLFSELMFINNCIERDYVSPDIAVKGWQGPLQASHDFVFRQSVIEVKSSMEPQHDVVFISSENQLQSHLEHLYLHVFMLAIDRDCIIGTSLNGLVNKLQDKLENGLFDDLNRMLHLAGYTNKPEYDSPCFIISEERSYLVSDKFPRIVPGMLAKGIKQVSYQLMLSSISDFRCDLSALKE